MSANHNLLLIDGSNLAFRMFFALEMSNLRDKNGHPTWAVYGVLKALFDAIDFAKPTAIAAAFDLPEPSFRHESFEDYKANRPDEMPEDLVPQWDLVKEAFRRFHIPVLEEAGLEADDLIGIMAKKAEQEGYKVVILSGDKDLFQLVNDNISIALPQRGGGLEVYGTEEVIKKMGVKPNQVADYKGIAGDSSDNIPGVRGLGPKAATALLEKYESLEDIYNNITEVLPLKMKEKLIEQEDKARLSKYLATIITDPQYVKKCDLNLEHCHLDMPDTDSLISFLKDLEFVSILKRLPIVLKPFNNGNLAKVSVGELPESNERAIKTATTNYPSGQNENKWQSIEMEIKDLKVNPFVVLDEITLNALVKELSQVDSYAIDLETDGLNTMNCNIVGWAFAYNSGTQLKTFYIPVRHNDLKQLKPKAVIEQLKPILEDKAKLQIVQNAKFEHKIFKRLGIKLHSNFFDTMLASYIDNPSNKHGLKAQARRLLGLKMKDIEDLIGSGKKQITIDFAEIEQVANYAASDAHATYLLYEHYQNKLDKREIKLLETLEFPLVETLREIEDNGVSIDVPFLKELSSDIHHKINNIEQKIWLNSGENFNISSPKQLSNVLFEQLEFPTIGKKNKTGGYSTDIGTLEDLLTEQELNEKQQQIIKDIIEYRSLTKLASTYIDTLPTLLSKEDNKLHSDFNQVVTATGRLSSSNPNLQNIPIRSEYGRLIRKSFIPSAPDFLILSADYSQIELRVLAHMANEAALIDAFKQGQDIHKRTAMEIFDIKESEVTEDHRRVGKTLNFALIYMQGPFATAKQLDISMQEAKGFIDKYFKVFTKIKPFMDKVLDEAHQNEFVETMFGRRRYFRNINSPNKMLMKEEERQAFNATIQGSAADIMKIAMINTYSAIKDLRSKMILQVHDELVFEVHKDELELLQQIINDNMSQAAVLQVPLLVDIGYGANWLEA